MKNFSGVATEARWKRQAARLSSKQFEILRKMKIGCDYTADILGCHYTTLNVLAREGFCVWVNAGGLGTFNEPRMFRKYRRIK